MSTDGPVTLDNEVARVIDAAEEVSDPLDGIIEKTASDPGAPFAPELLEGLTALKNDDRAAFEVLRAQLKKAGCRVTALDDAIADRNGNAIRFYYDSDAATRRFRPNYIAYTERAGIAHYQIAFVYQSGTQSTASVRYTPSTLGGAAHKEDRLLERIELKHDDVVYLTYKLTY